MKRTLLRAAALTLASVALVSCTTVEPVHPAIGQSGAHEYAGLQGHSRPISTTSPEAQKWFDRGLLWVFGFNHDEAVRAFTEAAAYDPNHPMPWWGIALSHGMNINDPMVPPERWRLAKDAADQAMLRIDNASEQEAALVRAVAQRYTWPPPRSQRRYDDRYARAMERVYRQFPDDPDIATLYAESLMNLQPWDYWTHEGEPKGRINEIVAIIERGMDAYPYHPGLNHLYIHAVEASQTPERAEAAADRLRPLVPGSGHLVHMPSHIYVRVGRYADATDTNVEAAAVDRRYFEKAPPPAIYAMYYAHNIHFIAYACMMEGRFEQAIEAARRLESEIPEEALREFAGLIEGLTSTTFHVLVRFGKWEEILREPERPDYRLFTNAVRHYARGIAYSATGRPAEARVEQRLFEEAARRVPEDWFVMQNRAHDILPIASAMLEGETLYREGDRERAYKVLRGAIAREDRLVYDEPPAWMLPVRHALGALLMADGRFADAERVYREDLKIHRENGWALLGLSESLIAQGRAKDAELLSVRLASAWARADTKATSSCFCEPKRAGR